MSINKELQIIVLFALLHAAVCILAKLFGFYNELLLTLLTMAMSVVLSMNQHMNPFMTVIWVLVANGAGLLLGPALGDFMKQVFHSSFYKTYLNSAMTTFSATIIVGGFQGLSSGLIKDHKYCKATDTHSITWLLVAFCAIMIVRMLMILNRSLDRIEDNFILNISLDYVVSCAVIFYIVRYAFKAEKDMAREKKKRNLAQFSYQRLKQQIEPHFLFNTLNTLDGLVCEQNTEQASLFIHKLSSFYRYMIENENEKIIYISEEILFANKYIDLLSVRFADGFKVNINISEEDRMRSVVPCALQILVENATKHNIIMPGLPLTVDISVEDGWIVVSNPVNPKKTSQPSTGKGLKYLSQLYRDVSGRDIRIINNQKTFEVRLPLL